MVEHSTDQPSAPPQDEFHAALKMVGRGRAVGIERYPLQRTVTVQTRVSLAMAGCGTIVLSGGCGDRYERIGKTRGQSQKPRAAG